MLEIDERVPEKDSRNDVLEWTRRHPAVTALGVVVLAALCLLPFSPRHRFSDRPAAEQSSDEAPLFI